MNLKKGKTSDYDGITAEHFLYAHPAVTSVILKLFQLIVKYGIVPDGFCNGLTFPVPKSSSRCHTASADDFRPITICPVMSKIFEYCLLLKLEKLMKTSTRQFGFKKGTGCNHATYLLKETIDYYTESNSNVSLGLLDLSKAFDKVNHFGLLMKLMERNVHPNVIKVLVYWYSRISTCVVWNGCRSIKVILKSGIKQGGILSPHFFSVNVDELLKQLEESNIGCYVRGFCLNSLMYADDLVLIAITIKDLKLLMQICIEYFDKNDMPLNISKSKCMRFGNRYKLACSPITCKYGIMDWVCSAKYLGIYIVSGKRLSVNCDEAKKNFYGAFNAIYGRIGSKGTIDITLSLLRSVCTPIITYGMEILCSKNSTVLSRLSKTYDRAWMKFFSTFDVQIIRQCQFFTGYLPLSYQIAFRRVCFLDKFSCHPNPDLRALYSCFPQHTDLSAKYSLNENDSWLMIKRKLFKHFESSFE